MILSLTLGKSIYTADSPGPKKRVTPAVSLIAGKSSELSKEMDVIKICLHSHSFPLGNLKNSPCDTGKADFLVKGVPRYLHAVLNGTPQLGFKTLVVKWNFQLGQCYRWCQSSKNTVDPPYLWFQFPLVNYSPEADDPPSDNSVGSQQ